MQRGTASVGEQAIPAGRSNATMDNHKGTREERSGRAVRGGGALTFLRARAECEPRDKRLRALHPIRVHPRVPAARLCLRPQHSPRSLRFIPSTSASLGVHQRLDVRRNHPQIAQIPQIRARRGWNPRPCTAPVRHSAPRGNRNGAVTGRPQKSASGPCSVHVCCASAPQRGDFEALDTPVGTPWVHRLYTAGTPA